VSVTSVNECVRLETPVNDGIAVAETVGSASDAIVNKRNTGTRDERTRACPPDRCSEMDPTPRTVYHVRGRR